MLLNFAWIVEWGETETEYGFAVDTAGDVNGDGYAELLVGAPESWGVYHTDGMAFVYDGSPTGPEQDPSWVVDGSMLGVGYLGGSVSTAGDVNGDGYDDVIIGSDRRFGSGSFVYLGSPTGLETTPAWEAQDFAASVASDAGDVNGDGFDDVILGAPFWGVDVALAGRVYVHLGSALGLDPEPAWVIEGTFEGMNLGDSVGSAGDVNGDGFDDVIVGGTGLYGDDPGWAYVYLGSAAGLQNTPAWERPWTWTASGAGDVNGDGYGDVVVNPLDLDAIVVYHGSSAGLGATYAWMVEGDAADAGVYTHAAAGDVNGDGFGDLLVGSGQYSGANPNDGIAYVFLGSPAGLWAGPAWSQAGHEEYSEFGGALASAGDTNADGFDDVVVGASAVGYWSGSAVAFLGSGLVDADGDQVFDVEDPCIGDNTSGDLDLDGWCALDVSGQPEDCNDGESGAFPGAADVCDGLDFACDGIGDEVDLDLDGALACGDDCDDTDHDSHPGALELCDGADNVCSGLVGEEEIDSDGDGVMACAGDCDDTDPTESPLLIERCGDGIDNNCDGTADEAAVCAESASPDTGGCGGCTTQGAPAAPWAALVALLAVWRRRAAIGVRTKATSNPRDRGRGVEAHPHPS